MIRSSKNDAKKVDPSLSTAAEVSPIQQPIAEKEPMSSYSAPATATATTAKPQESSPTAIIGPKIRFKGELVGEEDLLIQGHVEGTIDLKGNNVIVGKQGVIKANVLAKTISIEGTVEGDVFGEERIAILSSSNVKGNLVADRVTLEDGAKFRGSIDMESGAQNSPLKEYGFSSMSSSKTPSFTADKEKSESSEPA
ncbi:hypothetical protein TDB9533_02697 [Thalassocella blandensis]|nr:hypothetical protein TDB9533_02697 [Thalassocella blandensis]